MHVELFIPRPFFENALADVDDRTEENIFYARIGRVWTADGVRFLVREPFTRRSPSEDEPMIEIQFRSGRPLQRRRIPNNIHLIMLFRIDPDTRQARWEGWYLMPTSSSEIEPVSVEQVRFIGNGMLSLDANQIDQNENGQMKHVLWERTRDALGPDAWQRYVNLKVALVGCGRLGSMVAWHLVLNGIREIVLVDPDYLEIHNLGESEVFLLDKGARSIFDGKHLKHYKVFALRRVLEEVRPLQSTKIRAIPKRVDIWIALNTIKQCDVLICCADNERSREHAGLISAYYYLPLIEGGTGIFTRDRRTKVKGIEVRLLYPWDICRACVEYDRFARMADDQEGLEETPDQNARFELIESLLPWWAERRGSLRSLNSIAAGLVLSALEEMVKGHAPSSFAWYGTLSEGIRRINISSSCGSPSCITKKGLGDWAL